ncbi:flavanone 3-dioxygenase 3-like [Nicotiana tabacum]|uniref:Flavanone 3-dioxygenase 3-like n=1 Tax=Nicotiana tabacum TaxID=4097 RepID=A0A1S3YR82_TOBAC|nr:PREDICTED: protein DMR6-LIKE OXYGENASE 1-like [Nicotiana tabacum]
MEKVILGESSVSSNSSSFTSATTITETGHTFIPKRYVLPPSQRPDGTLDLCPYTFLPIVDLSLLRPQIIEQVLLACKDLGFFKVVNHGIPQSVMKDALDVASEFFDLPNEEKMNLYSTNVYTPVRYGTSMNQSKDKACFWRDFLKHYSNPISSFIDLWPSNPTSYKKKMGDYAREVQKLHEQLMEVVLESLGLDPNYLHEEIAQGSQVMAINSYPTCPEPDLTLGLPPHTDFGLLTIILQNHLGLQIMDKNEKWHSVPVVEGALMVQLGDQLEVLSNGIYKRIVHRAIVNSEKQRISIASIHSLALEKKIGPAPELVDEKNMLSYREGSFNDFLDHISGEDITQKNYIDKLKINQ